jgi:hypothetical protein
MPLPRTPPTPNNSTVRRPRFIVPRGLIAGTLAATALVWRPYALTSRSSLLSAPGGDVGCRHSFIVDCSKQLQQGSCNFREACTGRRPIRGFCQGL